MIVVARSGCRFFSRYSLSFLLVVLARITIDATMCSLALGQAFIPAKPVQPAPEELVTFQQQVRGLIQNELDLITALVKPNDSQSQALADVAESQWEATSLREVTRRVQQHVHGSIDFDGLVERSVSGWCKDILNEEQLKLYQAELQGRLDLRKEALIARMLTWLQNKLSLSASQTEEVEKVLRERWKDSGIVRSRLPLQTKPFARDQSEMARQHFDSSSKKCVGR